MRREEARGQRAQRLEILRGQEIGVGGDGVGDAGLEGRIDVIGVTRSRRRTRPSSCTAT
ncbi:hypothetical protein WMF37_31410 [Sorangium sp. So ce291]|uniref:hypothetical protein n=1 Tax=Sorangium sp. So ce291 TaxID=3133294 RepID=UPI003F60D216